MQIGAPGYRLFKIFFVNIAPSFLDFLMYNCSRDLILPMRSYEVSYFNLAITLKVNILQCYEFNLLFCKKGSVIRMMMPMLMTITNQI